MTKEKGSNFKSGNAIVVLLLLIGIMAVAFMFGQNAQSKGLKATATQTYQENILYINTEQDLVNFAQNVNEGNPYTGIHVLLQGDLDMSTVENFLPIGIYEDGNYFYGIFDGNGYSIKNLSITSEAGNANNGLFGSLGGTICNLTMENCYIKGFVCGAFCSIALSDNAGIYNCIVKDIEIDAPYTGIIGGQYFGALENCMVDGYICGEHYDVEKWEIRNIDTKVYNDNLEMLSAKCHNTPMCKWLDDGKLNHDNVVKASDMYIMIDSYSYKGKLKPYYKDDIYYFIVPSKELADSIILHVPEDEVETYDLARLPEGIYEQDVALKHADYQVKVCYAENTPSVFVDFENDWNMDYLKTLKTNIVYGGSVQVLDEHGVADYKGGLERMQGRGNDSWLMPKKGFSLNLIDDANLLDMGADKDYALLAGYRDSSLLTYKVVADLAKEMKLEYAPEYRLVNFYADGEYQGMYILAEKMNIGYNRVNIDSGNKDVSGGYLYELDDLDYEGELNLFKTEHGHTYLIKDPLVVKQSQLEYSITLWNLYEKAVYNTDGYNEFGGYYGDYMDIDSLAKLWLFLEINGEYSVSSSIYFYKDSDTHGDGKIHALYPWDVEHSFADENYITENVMQNINGSGTYGLWPAVYQHEDMQEAVYKNWVETFRPALCKLLESDTGYNDNSLSYIETYGEQYAVSSTWNELLWGDDQNMEQKGLFIKRYLEGRIPYLDEALKCE